MATRTEHPVTLSHQDAERVMRFLLEYTDWQLDRSRKSKAQPAVISLYRRDAEEARRLADTIMRHLYQWGE